MLAQNEDLRDFFIKIIKSPQRNFRFEKNRFFKNFRIIRNNGPSTHKTSETQFSTLTDSENVEKKLIFPVKTWFPHGISWFSLSELHTQQPTRLLWFRL